MARRSFTETWIKNLRPHEVRRDFTEAGRPGFMLRVWPAGQKSFVFRYTRNGHARIMTLGQWPVLTLEQAHDEHATARKVFLRGLDPIEEREREAKAREIREQHERHFHGITIRNVIAEWAWHYARRNRKRPREAVRLLKVYLKPWTGQPIQEKRRRDAIELLDKIVARGSLVMANRIRDLADQVFTFCVARDLITVNPFLGVPDPGGEEESKERALARDEIKTFWNAVDAPESGISRRLALALKLTLVTAQRPGEIIQARFDQFDLEQRVWTIPPEAIKTVKKAKRGKKKQARAPRVHCVPLSDTAIQLVEELRTLANGRPCLLPTQRSKKNPDGHIEEKALAHALRDSIDEKAGTLFGLQPFTPHDLRRTAATMMTSLGIPRHPDVAKVLNHAEEEDDTTAIYDRWEYWPQKQKALDVWHSELREIISGKASKVVPIARERRA